MDRRKSFFEQIVGDQDLNGLQSSIEQADQRIIGDHLQLLAGVVNGLEVSPTAPATMSLQVSAGVAYDGTVLPNRIPVPAAVTVDCSQDISGTPVLPPSGQTRIVLLTVRQTRQEYDPQTQADGTDANYRSDEAATFEVYAGIPDPSSPIAPAVPRSNVVLCRLVVSSTQTSFSNADISYVGRNQFFWEDDGAGKLLPLGVKDAIVAVSRATYGNLQVYPLEQGPKGSMAAVVNIGWANSGHQRLSISVPTQLALTFPSVGQYQVALIYLSELGAPSVTYSPSSVSPWPAAPGHEIGIPLAEVHLDGTKGTFSTGDVVDVRSFVGKSSVNNQRQRKMMVAVDSGGPGSGQRIFDLSASSIRYVVGNSSLNVFKNGLLLSIEASDYAETDSHTVTLSTAAAAGDKLVFEVDVPTGQLSAAPHAATHGATGSDPIDYSSLNGMVCGSFHAAVDALGLSAITIDPFVMIAGGKMLANSSQVTVGSSVIEGGGSLTASTWYYLYGFANPDQTQPQKILFQLSTTAPGAGLLVKSTDSSKVYLGAFKTTSAATFKACHRFGRETLYLGDVTLSWDGGNSYGLGFASAVSNGVVSPAATSVAVLVPPTARFGKFSLFSAGTPGLPLVLATGENPDLGLFNRIMLKLGVAGSVQGECLMSTGQTVEVNGQAGASGSIVFAVVGFRD